jgi:hypothetical protein
MSQSDLDAVDRGIPAIAPRGKGSHETLRWREMDSNFRFRARSTFAARPRVGWRDSRNLLSPPPLSPRDHPACGLAISALHAELSRRRGTPRRTGARHLLRERRSWVLNFGPVIARRLRWFRPRPSNRWHLDEMVVRIAGARMYCGVPSTTKARFSTCWFSGGAILRGGCGRMSPWPALISLWTATT